MSMTFLLPTGAGRRAVDRGASTAAWQLERLPADMEAPDMRDVTEWRRLRA